MIVPIVLSGGVGSRLWPLSREYMPKQLMPIIDGEHSLLQTTLMRLAAIPESSPPILVCNEIHRFLAAAQIQSIQVPCSPIILEPEGRNTCPAIALGALAASADGKDPDLLVMPADHLIGDADRFAAAVLKARELSSGGNLVTFGIVPDRPETGYGYIKRGESVVNARGENGAYRVCEFAEKPDCERARSYVASREYFWNSGMFMFRASTFLEELRNHSPEILEACRQAYGRAARDHDFLRPEEHSFLSCPNVSIDYAVMEKTRRAAVIPLEATWSDVGSWLSLHEVSKKDENGNVVAGDVMLKDTRNCYVHSESRLVSALGIENAIIVETKDAVLISAMDRAQDVKKIVGELKARSREETLSPARVCRPWGAYESVDTGERFQVKRITVAPGASLSLQMHYHRAEHWIVVRGTARIVKGDEVFLLSEDQSTYIPCGVRHRLENPGKIPLELIEVQSGSYLGEDDICRFEDHYGRCGA